MPDLIGVKAVYLKEHGRNPAILRSHDDVDALIDWLSTAPPYHNLAELHSLDRPLLDNGFPAHELLVGIDGSLGVGALEFMDEAGNVVTLGEDEGRPDPVYWIMGNPTEFPGRSEVAIDVIRQAVKEFLASKGRRPTCVQWQVPEVW